VVPSGVLARDIMYYGVYCVSFCIYTHARAVIIGTTVVVVGGEDLPVGTAP